MKRRTINRITGLLLALTMLFGMIPLSVSAEEDNLPTVQIGEVWSASWTAEDMLAAANLNITETGLYTIDVFANENAGTTYYVSVYNITDDTLVASETGEAIQTKGHVYLCDEKEYGILAYAVSGNSYVEGQLSVWIRKQENLPAELELGTAVKDSDGKDGCWFSYTPDTSGDYQLLLNRQNRYTVYTYSLTANEVNSRSTRFTNYTTDKLIVNLRAGDTYYFYIPKFEYIHSLTLTQCEKTVDTIEGNEALWSLFNYPSNNPDIEEWCDFRVIYTDGTHDILTFTQIGWRGLPLPKLTFYGNTIDLFGITYYQGGEQILEVDYNGHLSYLLINVQTVRSTESVERVEPITSGTNRQLYYSFHVDKTGVYSLYSTSSGEAYISYFVVDQYYRPVQYNEKLGGFPLVKGQSYCVHGRYSATANSSVFFKNENKVLYPDTHPSAWYYDAVSYATGSGIMTGYASNGNFGTSDQIQRQDFLVMLARVAGVDLTGYQDDHGLFPDVAANSYYEAAINWGYESGIATGYQNGCFGVGDPLTREQLVTFLYRYAQYCMRDVTYNESLLQTYRNTYTDFGKVSPFSKDAIVWALDRGVIKGKTANTIVPYGNAQRCEVAQMMYNVFLNNTF